MLRKKALLPLLLTAGLVVPATVAAQGDEPRGRFALRAVLGGAQVARNGFDDSAMAAGSGVLAVNDNLSATVGLRYLPEFSAGSGNSRGKVEVTMFHVGGEIGIPMGTVTPFLRPELNAWEAAAEYQGRSLEDEQGVSPALYAGVKLRLHRRFGLIVEGGRSFDVSGTDLDTLGVGLTFHF